MASPSQSIQKETATVDPSCGMNASSGSEFVSLVASANEHATSSSSTMFFSALAKTLCCEKEEEIERSKLHWSQLAKFDHDDDEVAQVSNAKFFKLLQMHPSWGRFFRTFGDGGIHDYGELVVGEKFAEGGQAELFHACVTWKTANPNSGGYMCVLKVFREGTFLSDLQKQWPLGMFREFEDREQRNRRGHLQALQFTTDIGCGTLLKDGRFAFLMARETEDLRTLLDRWMKARTSLDFGPLPTKATTFIMYCVARGLNHLHNLDIVHRDLKASNVLCARYGDVGNLNSHQFFVADFECSIGVVGTGFFRAPEILQAVKDRVVYSTPNIFTKAADIYSYGMVCYEILTGRLPFEGHRANEYDLVLKGQRPELPNYVVEWARELLHRCWQLEPAKRPTTREILSLLESNSKECKETGEKFDEYDTRVRSGDLSGLRFAQRHQF